MTTPSARANKQPTDLGVLGLEATKRALDQERGAPHVLAKPKILFKDDPEYSVKNWGHETEEEIAAKARAASAARTTVNDKFLVAKQLVLHAIKTLLLQRFARQALTYFGQTSVWANRLSWLGVIALNLWRYGTGGKLNPQLSAKGMLWLPFLGHALPMMMNKSRSHDFLLETSRLNNMEPVEIQIPGNSFVSLMDARDREYMLRTNFRNFKKNREGDIGSFEHVFSEVMGRGIFATDTKEWMDSRKIASHMFSGKSLEEKMEQVFNKHAEHFVAYLDKVSQRGGANGNVVDIQAAFQSSIFDGFCEIAFGISPACLDMLMEDGGKKFPFLTAFDHCQCHAAERFLDLPMLWHLQRLAAHVFNLGPEAEFARNLKILDDYVAPIIRARLDDPDAANKQDLLSLYINHARNTNQKHMLEVDYLRDLVINFMIAGRDTTSATLSYMMKYLGENPAVHERLMEELKQTGSLRQDKGEVIRLEETKSTPFADAVINEVLRMAPPVVTEIRFCVGDDVLPSGLRVVDGTRIIIPNRVIGRDPYLWSEPDSFIPERWMAYDENGVAQPVKRPDEYVFPVFWSGKRLCLGKDMARFEMHVFMRYIYAKFKITPLPGQCEDVVSGPVLFAKEGIFCRVERLVE